jgi:undecaprenyl-diphosphatase
VLLGIVQGLTEFLPVSSSAHLIIFQKLLNLSGNELTLSLILHLGTSFALLIFFFKDILKMLKDFKMLLLIIIVTIITGIIGLSGKDFFESLFSSTVPAAFALIITGIILILTKKFIYKGRQELNIKDAFILGISQGIAVIPGISRSGITISSLLFRGIEKETAFKFSFLASIPAVFGAAILEAKEINLASPLNIKNLVIGFAVSLLTGILSLWILRLVLKKAKLHYFGYYCIIVAVITLLFVK